MTPQECFALREALYPTDNPQDLACRLQRGDADALTALVEAFHRPVLGLIYHRVYDAALAEDYTQETFLRMMRSIHLYDVSRPFKPWLYAIALNIVRDHFKRADTRRTLPLPPMDDHGVDFAPATETPESLTLDAEEHDQVSLALGQLSAVHREAILLRYYHELSLAEIAETLNIPLGTVKSRLANGLRHLKSLLEAEA